MGACLSKLGINIGVSASVDVPNVVTEDLLKTISDALVDALLEFPESFNWERRRIVWDMWWEGEKGWLDETYGKERLFWKDFPGNDSKVIQVALAIASGEALKSVLGEVVHSIVDPDIDSKLNEHPYPVRSPAKKAADKAIEKSIDEAVNKAVEQLKKQIEGSPDFVPKFETPSEEERKGGKKTAANPCHEKMKAKKK